MVIVTSFMRDFVRDSVSSTIDYRALNFVPGSFDAFISSTVSRSFV